MNEFVRTFSFLVSYLRTHFSFLLIYFSALLIYFSILLISFPFSVMCLSLPHILILLTHVLYLSFELNNVLFLQICLYFWPLLFSFVFTNSSLPIPGPDHNSHASVFFPGAKTTVYEVSDPLQLPFAAQCLVDNAGVSVVVAIGFLVSDAYWCSKEVTTHTTTVR